MNELLNSFSLLAHLLSDASLRSISTVSKSFLSQCSLLGRTNNFHKQRVEHLLRTEVHMLETNWRHIYYVLDECLSASDSHFTLAALQSPVCVSLLLIGCTMDEALDDSCTFDLACETGSREVVSMFLVDPRSKISSHTSVVCACSNTNSDVLSLLLSDERTRSLLSEELLLECFKEGTEETLYVLIERALSEEEVDVSFNESQLLLEACSAGYVSLVRLLATAPGIDLEAQQGLPLTIACRRGRIEVVRLFLSGCLVQASVASCSRGFAHACETGQLDVIELLLSDSRALLSAMSVVR